MVKLTNAQGANPGHNLIETVPVGLVSPAKMPTNKEIYENRKIFIWMLGFVLCFSVK